MRHVFLPILAALLTSAAAPAQVFVQQGSKLVVTGQPYSVIGIGFTLALSADGNTAVFGDEMDNNYTGAMWVFTRDANGYWSQQGAKLVGTGAVSCQGCYFGQGSSVAISADGNTAAEAGANAVWVFTRDAGGNWTQQGSQLVGASPVPSSTQGISLAISADGNTLAEGGSDYSGTVWIFTRDSSGNWIQQGPSLVATGISGSQAYFGNSVALSADGNTAIVGGPGDNSGIGAAWVFTRDSSGNWSQQGGKLSGTDEPYVAASGSGQGAAVALSADGNTAAVGGPGDSTGLGATWIFTRDSSGNWTQQGSKLVGADALSISFFGVGMGGSVSLSGDGNTLLVGGGGDNHFLGAAWIFSRDASGHWSQLQNKLVGGGNFSFYGSVATGLGSAVALSADGNTALEGGPGYNYPQGAVWVFTRAPCQLSVSPYPEAPFSLDGSPTTMGANFTPTNASGQPIGLAAAATACGFTGFNWQQQIDLLPAPSPFFPFNKSLALSGGMQPANISSNGSLQALPGFSDPPLGGYTFQPAGDLAYPFFWSANELAGALSPCAHTPIKTANTLIFEDCPADSLLSSGQYIEFITSLVGVLPSGAPSTPLFTWTWQTTFNGSNLGGISQTKSVSPTIPASGTGGVAITNFNSPQLPSLVPASEIATTSSGLTYSRLSQTFNGTITLRNIGATTISGPIQLVFMGLTPSVTLVTAVNFISGTPYLTVPAASGLGVGQSTTLTVQFKNPFNVTINFTPVIYSGSMN